MNVAALELVDAAEPSLSFGTAHFAITMYYMWCYIGVQVNVLHDGGYNGAPTLSSATSVNT